LSISLHFEQSGLAEGIARRNRASKGGGSALYEDFIASISGAGIESKNRGRRADPFVD
jgi:hypothetical protein